MLLPWPERGAVAVQAPGTGPGYWAGAPCAVAGDGEIFLAYRLRRPAGFGQSRGRGYAVAVARSADGERFETLLSIGKEEMATESLERPAAGPHAGGTLAAVPELRDVRDQALAGGDDRGRAPGRVRRRAAGGDPARGRQDRREGPGDPVPRRPVAPVGVVPPAGRPAPGRPDDHRVRDQRRRPGLDLARHRAERDAGPVGRPGHAGHRGGLRRGWGDGLLRRAGERGGEF